MNSKDKILFFDDESSMRQYMLTGRVIPPEWRNGNLLLKKFNPWLYDPETAQVQNKPDSIHDVILHELEKAEDIIAYKILKDIGVTK